MDERSNDNNVESNTVCEPPTFNKAARSVDVTILAGFGFGFAFLVVAIIVLLIVSEREIKFL